MRKMGLVFFNVDDEMFLPGFLVFFKGGCLDPIKTGDRTQGPQTVSKMRNASLNWCGI